jgi:hypothetical protein
MATIQKPANKIILNGTTLLDLSEATPETTSEDILEGNIVYGKNGVKIVGSLTSAQFYEEATATSANQVLDGVTVYGKDGEVIHGTLSPGSDLLSGYYVYDEDTDTYTFIGSEADEQGAPISINMKVWVPDKDDLDTGNCFVSYTTEKGAVVSEALTEFSIEYDPDAMESYFIIEALKNTLVAIHLNYSTSVVDYVSFPSSLVGVQRFIVTNGANSVVDIAVKATDSFKTEGLRIVLEE